MDLSKALDCIPHDLLATKCHAYGLSKDAVTFVHSYLNRRKQGVKINDTERVFQIILSGIPQGSVLGFILFYVLINDLLPFFISIKLRSILRFRGLKK